MQLSSVVGGQTEKAGMMVAVELRVDIIATGHLTGALLFFTIGVSIFEKENKNFSVLN
jgi:hypothetical protein